MMKQRWSVEVWLCVMAASASFLAWRMIEPATAQMQEPQGVQEQCLQPPSSVAAWYRGENNAADSVGLSDGYALGGLSFAAGKAGQAFRFDGVDDRLLIPGSDKLNVGESSGFTLELWVNPATLSAGRVGIPLAEWNDGNGNGGAGVQLWLSLFCVGGCRETPGVLYANLVDIQGKNHLLQTGSSTMKANEFQHLALTYDKATGSTRLYRNGEFEQGTFLENFTPMTNRALYLGSRPNSDHAVFNGLMDEVTVHNRWLSQDEVKAIFQAGAAGKCAPACTPSPPGLLAWYRAEGNGSDAAGSSAGQLKNGATTAPGKIGQAFHLDGVDDFVEVADSPVLKPARLSVEAWARFDSLDAPGVSAPGLQYLVFKQNSRATQFEGYALYKYRLDGVDRLIFGVASASGAQVFAASKTPIAAGRFYHAVGTYDGSAVRLYVNGALEAETPADFPLNYGARPVYIGTSGEGFDGKFKGQIDEVSIYGRALNAQEVNSLFGAFAAGKCAQAPPNTPPVISAADPVSRQQGSPAVEGDIAKVSDAQSAAGELKVSATAPAGISVNNIKNVAGAISAEIAALCNATAGINLVALTVVDGNGATATANLSVSVTTNTPPRLGQYPATTVSIGGAAAASPTAPPADNGSITAVTAAAEGFMGTISLNPATGVVSIGNARPAGNYTVSVRATDNCGATSTTTFPLVIQAGALGLASAANFAAPIAPDSVVSAFGLRLATATQTASTLPLPTTLAGTTARVRDASGT
ncbi:MAG: LamG-like jellyroll fold domain-containing protein, partial [Blastocatellia bacterium]